MEVFEKNACSCSGDNDVLLFPISRVQRLFFHLANFYTCNVTYLFKLQRPPYRFEYTMHFTAYNA